MNWITLITVVIAHISDIERIGTEFSGSDKKLAVLDSIRTALTITSDITGKNIIPSDETMRVVGELIDIVVSAMNLAKNPDNLTQK